MIPHISDLMKMSFGIVMAKFHGMHARCSSSLLNFIDRECEAVINAIIVFDALE